MFFALTYFDFQHKHIFKEEKKYKDYPRIFAF